MKVSEKPFKADIIRLQMVKLPSKGESTRLRKFIGIVLYLQDSNSKESQKNIRRTRIQNIILNVKIFN